MHHHAVIWIDHREARVFHFSATDVEGLVLHPENPTRHIHHKANSNGSGNAASKRRYARRSRPEILPGSGSHAGVNRLSGRTRSAASLYLVFGFATGPLSKRWRFSFSAARPARPASRRLRPAFAGRSIASSSAAPEVSGKSP
jgi:hypothetical protein